MTGLTASGAKGTGDMEKARTNAWWRGPQWTWFRQHLTPEERRNLQASRVPVAVVTASLGGHAYTYRDRA